MHLSELNTLRLKTYGNRIHLFERIASAHGPELNILVGIECIASAHRLELNTFVGIECIANVHIRTGIQHFLKN